MKITLIYPAISIKERYGVDIGDIGGKQSPLGVLYLSSFLKKYNHKVQVIDAEALLLSNDNIIDIVAKESPDVVAISTTTVAFHNSVNLAKYIAIKLPKSILVVGGAHVTANPTETIATKAFDFAITKEGEETFLELIETLIKEDYIENFKSIKPSKIKNLAASNEVCIGNKLLRRDAQLKKQFRELQLNPPVGSKDLPNAFFKVKGIIFYSNNKIIKTKEREYIKDIDILPFPDRDQLFDITRYRPPIGCYREKFSVSMITSRGCPYNCVFCDNNTFGRKTRWFSPKYVVDEIELILTKYKAKEISFVDDTFPANRKRFIDILNLIEKRNLKFVWNCMANVNDLDNELLSLMKKAGCWQIAIGIESGDDAILKLIKKGISVDKVRKVVNAADKIGISMKGFFMLGHPGETEESMKKTLELALELPLTDVTCTINTPIKGTELYSMALSGKYGEFNANADNSQLNYWEPIFIPHSLTKDQLYKVQRDFFKRFYFRKSILLKQIKKIKNITVLYRLLVTICKLIIQPPK